MWVGIFFDIASKGWDAHILMKERARQGEFQTHRDFVLGLIKRQMKYVRMRQSHRQVWPCEGFLAVSHNYGVLLSLGSLVKTESGAVFELANYSEQL